MCQQVGAVLKGSYNIMQGYQQLIARAKEMLQNNENELAIILATTAGEICVENIMINKLNWKPKNDWERYHIFTRKNLRKHLRISQKRDITKENFYIEYESNKYNELRNQIVHAGQVATHQQAEGYLDCIEKLVHYLS